MNINLQNAGTIARDDILKGLTGWSVNIDTGRKGVWHDVEITDVDLDKIEIKIGDPSSHRYTDIAFGDITTIVVNS